jgi:hypothetical protein
LQKPWSGDHFKVTDPFQEVFENEGIVVKKPAAAPVIMEFII